LLTKWLAKYGYLPIVLTGMAGLALEIGTGEWKSGDTFVAAAPVVAAHYVEHASKTQVALTAKKKTKVAAIAK
jgi:hypothetical protein